VWKNIGGVRWRRSVITGRRDGDLTIRRNTGALLEVGEVRDDSDLRDMM
jgi:hypothetical protein